MGFRSRVAPLAAVAASLALVTGCSGGSSSVPVSSSVPTQHSSGQQPASTASTVKRSASAGSTTPFAKPLALPAVRRHQSTWFTTGHTITNLVFVADTTNNDVEIFDFATKMQVGQIGAVNVPEGLATDASANLYESDTSSQDVQIFAPPYTGTPTVLEDQGYFPVGLHKDGNGNLWVANICSGFGGNCTGGGNVIEYPSGSTTAVTLNGGPYRAYFVTTDPQGNVWADGQDSSFNPVIGYWAGGTGSFIPVNISMTFPGGIAFDSSGNLLLDDQSGASNGGSILNIYAPGSTTPSGSINLQNSGDDVVTFAVGTAQRRLFAPQLFAGTTHIIKYPEGHWIAGFRPTMFGNPDAVAASPGTLP